MRPAQLANQNGLAWSGGKEPKRLITCVVYAKPPAALIGNSSLYYRTEQLFESLFLRFDKTLTVKMKSRDFGTRQDKLCAL